LQDSFGIDLFTDVMKLAFGFFQESRPYCGSPESWPNPTEQPWCGMGIATFEWGDPFPLSGFKKTKVEQVISLYLD